MEVSPAPRGVVGSSSRRKQRWQSLSGESVVLSGGYRDEDVSCYAAYSPCLLLETEESPSTSDYDDMDDDLDFPLKDLPPSMATPPRSPGPQIPEPLLEDLLDLWNENMEDDDQLDFPSDDDRLFDELVDLAKYVEAEARVKCEPLSAPPSPAQLREEVDMPPLNSIVVKEEMVSHMEYKESREVDPFLCAAPFSSNWLETPPPTVPSSPSADMVDDNDEEEDELLNEIYHQLEMNEEVVKNDCMWGCEELNSLSTSPPTVSIKEEPEEIVETEEELTLRLRIAATVNDHCYAAPYSEEETATLRILPSRSESPVSDDERGPTVKKTKILVPLKDLMETLQQKSYLVAPLGPGKKVIRLTGSDSVKGVLPFSSSSSLASFLPKSSPALKCVQQQQKLKVKFESRSSGNVGNRSPKLCLVERPGGKKTKTHNNMERMRRIDLRNSFENLKKLVPPLSKSSKSSKVEILRKAEEYIRALKSLEGRLLKETSSLRAKNDLLRERISGLLGG